MNPSRFKIFKTFLFLPSIAFLLITCQPNKENNNIPIQAVFPEQSISEIADTVFIGQIRDFRYADGMFYWSQGKPHGLLAVDKDFKLQWGYAQKGKGPREYVYPDKIAVSGTNIFLSNPGGKNILKISRKGKYESTLDFPQGYNSTSKFGVNATGNIFFNNPGGGKNPPISVLNSKEKIQREFGYVIPAEREVVRFTKNRRDIHMMENGNILSVGISYPLVEIYNAEGKRLSHFDLSQSEIFREGMEMIKERYKKMEDGNFVTLVNISDIYYTNNQLYLSTTINIKTTREQVILSYSTKDDDLTLENIYELKNKGKDRVIYTNFCLFNNQKSLVAYDLVGQTLDIFRLPQAALVQASRPSCKRLACLPACTFIFAFK